MVTSTTDLQQVIYSDLRAQLSTRLKEVKTIGKRFKIVRNGEVEGILISPAEREDMIETLAIVNSPSLMRQLIASEKDLRAGRVRDAAVVFDEFLDQGCRRLCAGTG